MSENHAELFIEVVLDGGDHAELDELTRQLKAEVEDLSVWGSRSIGAILFVGR